MVRNKVYTVWSYFLPQLYQVLPDVLQIDHSVLGYTIVVRTFGDQFEKLKYLILVFSCRFSTG